MIQAFLQSLLGAGGWEV